MAAQRRIQALIDQCPEGDFKRLKNYLFIEEDQVVLKQSMWTIWRERIMMVLILVIIIGPWLAGFFTLAIWLISLIIPPFGQYLLTHWFDILNLIQE